MAGDITSGKVGVIVLGQHFRVGHAEPGIDGRANRLRFKFIAIFIGWYRYIQRTIVGSFRWLGKDTVLTRGAEYAGCADNFTQCTDRPDSSAGIVDRCCIDIFNRYDQIIRADRDIIRISC